MNRQLSWQFTWNLNSYFSGKSYLRMLYVTVVTSAFRFNYDLHVCRFVLTFVADSESLSGGSDLDVPCLGYDTVRRSGSLGSEMSDDDYGNMNTMDQKPVIKRKYTTQRRKHPSGDSTQEKQQNRGRKPGQSKNHFRYIESLLKSWRKL